MVFTQYRILAYILVPLAIGGVSYFYGYQAASNKCRAEAEKALSIAIEEAKKNGAQDKKLAEKAIKDYNETKGRLDDIVEDVKQAVEAAPNPSCVITDDELQSLNSF
jgi:hypothetical protein